MAQRELSKQYWSPPSAPQISCPKPPVEPSSGIMEHLNGLYDRQEGYLATFWTVAMLTLATIRELNGTLSLSALRGTLHQLGLRWGRPKLAMPAKVDPEKAQKQWRIAKAAVEAPPEAAILYAANPGSSSCL